MRLACGIMCSASFVVVSLAIACQLVSSLASPSDSNNTSTADNSTQDWIVLESEKIFVSLENGTTFGIWIESDDKVDVLQRKIFEIVGIHPTRQRLSIGKHFLQADYLLSNYGIKAGSIVSLDTWRNGVELLTNFDVISLTRARLPISTRLSDTVASLKETLAQSTNIPSQEQLRLVVNGKELADERQLLDYDIWNGSEVYIRAPIDTCRGEAKIHLETLSGATLPVDIDLSERVEKLKEKIQDLTGAPVSVQLLMFAQTTLNEPDHLCDYGLENGSRVHMAFVSRRVTNFSIVKQLKALAREPIFREGSEDRRASLDIRRRLIYNDRRNWASHELRSKPHLIFVDLSPTAYLQLDPDDFDSMERVRVLLNHSALSDSSWSNKAARAQYQIATILRPYRAGLKMGARERPGLRLGATWDPQCPLSANLNNFAPNEFADEEIMYLFGLAEKIRRRLERDERTGESTLSNRELRSYNGKLLRSYMEALAGMPLAVENYQPPADEDCAMCRESLQLEPAFKPPCGHGNHIDCALSWILEQRKKDSDAMCPYCRTPFRFSFATYVKDELDWANEKY